VSSEDAVVASVVDSSGREVVLLSRVWNEKIVRDHPEMAGHLDALIETVAQPDHVELDPLADRTRYYRRNVGPSHWLVAVVSYEQQPARIITALANRKDPRTWKP
jgi:hypothetical protein